MEHLVPQLGGRWRHVDRPRERLRREHRRRIQEAAGFEEFYGDYGEIAITNAGKTIGTWGEAFSYTGPGGTWFNRQT